MTEKERKLREKRGTLIAEMKSFNDGIEGKMTADQETRWAKMNEDLDAIDQSLERDKRMADLDDGGSGDSEIIKPETRDGRKAAPANEIRELETRFTSSGRSGLTDEEFGKLHMQTFRRFLLGGERGLRPIDQAVVSALDTRALQMDADIYGGYLVTPQQFVAGLLKGVDNEVFIRRLATTTQVPTAASLGMASLENDPADPAWTKEIGTGNEDSTMSFGKRELYPQPLAKLIKVSEKLLRATSNNVESIVNDRLRYKFSVTLENAYINGTGSNQPLGLMTASDDGIPTSRDVSTGNTATAVTFDNLIEVKYALKGQYWAKAVWMFHRTILKQIRKLKNGEGQYIWQESVLPGEPDRILGAPVYMSEYMPNTATANLYVGLFGDLSFYHIADALDMRMQRLVELYAATNQVGFIGRLESDGLPVLSEAFARVKLGA